MVRGGRIGCDDDTQAGSGGGGVARHRILEGQRLGRIEAQLGECGEVEIGCGFAVWHVLAAEHGVKMLEQAAQGELALDVRVAGVGGDGESQSGFAGLGEKGGHARADRGGGHEFAGKAEVPALEAGFVVVWRIRLPDVGDDIDMSDQRVQDGGTGLAAILRMDGEPRVNDGGFGIHDKSVEIEYEAA